MVNKQRDCAGSRVDDTRLLLTARRSAVSMAVAAALTGALAMPAMAQDDDGAGEVIEEVIATGYRGSLRNSMLMKQNNDSIVEAVTAEDIGKLPDASIAESLARLPGLTAQRLNGRGQQISIRGLGPDFTTALLNGREQVTTGDNRGVEFDQYPSELLSSVVIYKTPDASLIGQGLSGTADLRTIRPLQQGNRILAGNLRFEQTEFDKVTGEDNTGHRFSFTYVDQFAEDRFGLAIGVANMENPGQEERMQVWGYADGPSGSVVAGGAKPFIRASMLERTGAIGVLEFQPNDRVTAALDLYYSEFEETQTLKGIEVPLQWGGGGEQLLNPTIDDGLVTAGQWTGINNVVRNDVTARDSELFSAGFNVNFDVGENWVVDADIATSRVDRKDLIFEAWAGRGYNYQNAPGAVLANMTFNQIGDPGLVFNADQSWDDPNQLVLTDPRGWGGSTVQAGYEKIFNIEDELNQFGLTVRRDLSSAINFMEFGINYAEREKTKETDEARLNFGLDGNGAQIETAPIPSANGTADLGFTGLGNIVTYDSVNFPYTRVDNFNADISLKSWQVKEEVSIAYAMFGVDTDLGRYPLTGNFGLQYMYVDQSSSALATASFDSNTQAAISGGTDWNEVLPSVNLTMDFNNDTYLKFAVARTVARARMDQLRAAYRISFNNDRRNNTDPNNSPWSGDGGNPTVKPWVADGIDLSIEKYFASGSGYVSAAVFYKDLKEWVVDLPVPFDFSDVPPPPPAPGQDPTVGTNLGFITAPVNGEGGDISGIELSFQATMDMFTQNWFRDFGIVANYSYTDSSIEPVEGVEIPIPGLSEQVANLTLFYENENFGARVSNRYRSDFLGEVEGFGGDRDFRQIRSESVVDAQISYTFTTGAVQGLSLMLQGFNLTNEPLGSFEIGDERLTRDYQLYGRSYMIGAAYRYE